MIRLFYVMTILLLSPDAVSGQTFQKLKTFVTNLKCYFGECCSANWKPESYTALENMLEAKLYGQHLVQDILIKQLKEHGNGNPQKALVISLHGGPGTGKTYVARMVAQTFYEKGLESKYVHILSANKDFLHASDVHRYKDELREKIKKSVEECPRSFFIFDEMHRMPRGIIDTLKPYLDFYEIIEGIDYRKAVFFFLSNTGGGEINKRAFKAWKDGEERNSLKLPEMEDIIRQSLQATQDGMKDSQLIVNGLITAYIPFLPLERGHVKRCIRDELARRNYRRVSETEVQQVADIIRFFPKEHLIHAAYGCKDVPPTITNFFRSPRTEL